MTTLVPGHGSAAPSNAGPKIMLVSGIVCLALTATAWVGAGVVFSGGLPPDVVTDDGSDGEAVLGAVELPGAGSVRLDPGAYTVHLAAPGGSSVGLTDVQGLADATQAALTVTAPDGADLVTTEPSVGTAAEVTDVVVASVASFVAEDAGEYRIAAQGPEPVDGDPFRLLVTPDVEWDLPAMAGSIGLHLLAILLGLLGLGLTIGGGVWLHQQGRRTEAAHGAPAPWR